MDPGAGPAPEPPGGPGKDATGTSSGASRDGAAGEYSNLASKLAPSQVQCTLLKIAGRSEAAAVEGLSLVASCIRACVHVCARVHNLDDDVGGQWWRRLGCRRSRARRAAAPTESSVRWPTARAESCASCTLTYPQARASVLLEGASVSFAALSVPLAPKLGLLCTMRVRPTVQTIEPCCVGRPQTAARAPCSAPSGWHVQLPAFGNQGTLQRR
jgi:hypothetical protein